MKQASGRPWRAVPGLALALGVYALLMHGMVERAMQTRAPLPNGAQGDQAFYAWAIERARTSPTFRDYVVNCDWSASGCTDLRSVPQEWPSFYMLGKLARLAGGDSASFLSGWYFLAVLLNTLAAAWFIAAVSRSWWLAGALAPLVGFQQSLAWRLNGHLPLASAWPLIGAMAAFWRVCETIRDRGPRRVLLVRLLVFLVLLLGAALSSYYYLIFGLLLFPLLLLAFVVVYWRQLGGFNLLRRAESGLVAAGIALTAGAFLAVAAAGPLGPGAPKDAPSYQRSSEDVRRCSAAWVDYVKPTGLSGSRDLLARIGLSLSVREVGDRFPHELHSYLGATFWAAVAATLIAAAAAMFIEQRRRRTPDERDRERRTLRLAVFTGLALVTAFLGTGFGGALVHRFVTAARCFNRLAPFVALFGCAVVAIFWARYRRAAPILAVLLAVATSAEYRHNGLVRPRLIQSTADHVDFAAALRPRCLLGMLTVDPPVADFMFGPYRLFYVAQLAGCRLDGIRGSGFIPGAGAAPARAPGVLRWIPPGNGFEQLRLDGGPDDKPWMVSLSGMGTGIRAIDVEPLSIDFGTVLVGSEPEPRLVMVRNNGTRPLSIGTLRLNGATPGEFQKGADACSGQRLAPSDSCSVQIFCTPRSAGSKTAKLIIPSSDRDERPVRVRLSGMGSNSATRRKIRRPKVSRFLCVAERR